MPPVPNRCLFYSFCLALQSWKFFTYCLGLLYELHCCPFRTCGCLSFPMASEDFESHCSEVNAWVATVWWKILHAASRKYTVASHSLIFLVHRSTFSWQRRNIFHSEAIHHRELVRSLVFLNIAKLMLHSITIPLLLYHSSTCPARNGCYCQANFSVSVGDLMEIPHSDGQWHIHMMYIIF